MWVRDLLNDRKWHHGDLHRLELLVRHRGAIGDTRVVFGAEILEIRPTGLLVRSDPMLPDDDAGEADGTVFLPYHRVLKVTGPEGVLWTRDDQDP